ncbi:MAG TPA: hypothetical protein VKZ98_03715 [Aquaticitalea sp.]|nr:hypothetical protein [Aquaticitalea sp.]
MKKLFTAGIFLAYILSFSQNLSFKPKLNHTYTYDMELIVVNSGAVELGFKTQTDTQFIEDNGFSMKLNRIQIKSSGFTIDSKYPENEEDHKKIEHLTSKPFMFKMENGKMILKSHKDIGEIAQIQEILNEFGKYYNPASNSFFKNIVQKEGYTWIETDSISNELFGKKNQEMKFHYTVKSVKSNQIEIHGNSSIYFKNDTTAIAVKHILDKKTGVSQYTKFISHQNFGPTVILINKADDFDAPTMLEEYGYFQPKLQYALMQNEGFNYDPIAYKDRKSPLISDKDFLNMSLKELFKQLSIETFDVPDQYFLSAYKFPVIAKYDSILEGAYVKIDKIKYFDENGATVALKQISSNEYYVPTHLGPFQGDFYQKVPEVTKISADITVFKPTRRKIKTIDSQIDNKQYKVQRIDSVTLISFKKLTNVDYKSFEFFDEKGNKLEAQWIPSMMYSEMINSQEALAQAFIEQAPGENEIKYTMKFVVDNPLIIKFAIYTKELKFNHKVNFFPNKS